MRLIDADALITWISDCLFDKSPNLRMTEAERHDAEVMYEALEKAIRGIEKMPSIDAVPVVRCKDCKHRYNSVECPCQSYTYEHFYSWMPADDWFCKKGERKEQ